jgi:uncharacterized protein (TIGR03083 family)
MLTIARDLIGEEDAVTETDADITGMLNEIAAAWEDLRASYAGLSDAQMQEPGVVDDWSVRDILAHVAVWDTEARNALPDIAAGRREQAYGTYDDIDAFNARKTEELRGMPLDDARRLMDDAHRQLLDYLHGISPDDIRVGRAKTFRERLASDTWMHYPEHTAAIRAFREEQGW